VILTHHSTLVSFRKAKKHSIATFAGAIGGSVGVLAVISLGLAISIIRRRRIYNRRERLSQDRSSLHTNASDDSPPMIGPRNFVPKYFPGTQIPSDPPPYIESMSMSSSTTNAASSPMMSSSITVPASYPAHLARIRDTSYVNVPPASPPLGGLSPLSLKSAISTPLPTFGEAKSVPPPIGLSHGIPAAGEAAQDSTDATMTYLMAADIRREL
jgi:hypothetical protein